MNKFQSNDARSIKYSSYEETIKFIYNNKDDILTKITNFKDDPITLLKDIPQEIINELYFEEDTIFISITKKIETNPIPFNLQGNYLFIVSSCIHPSLYGLCSGTIRVNIRSVFTHYERFLQTIETVKSIKKYIPNSSIILSESGYLFENEIKELSKYVDKFWFLSKEEKGICYKHNNKSFSEALSLYKTVFENKLQFDYTFKISGRYWIVDGFDIDIFMNNKITMAMPTSFEPGHGKCTLLYSVPFNLFEYFKERLKQTTELLKDNNHVIFDINGRLYSVSSYIENILFPLNDEKYNFIKKLYVSGYVSVYKDKMLFNA